MLAGQLDQRITLQSKTITRDALNQSIATWTSQGDVWAKVETLSGRALTLADQYDEPVTLGVTIRHGPAITSKWRVVWHEASGDRVLSIVSVLPLKKRNTGWLLMCAEGLRDG